MVLAFYLSWLAVFGQPQHQPGMWFYDPYKIQTEGVLNEYPGTLGLDRASSDHDMFRDDFVRTLTQGDGLPEK